MIKTFFFAFILINGTIFLYGCKKDNPVTDRAQTEYSILPPNNLSAATGGILLSAAAKGEKTQNASANCVCGTGIPAYRNATYTFSTNSLQSGEFKLQGGLTNFTAPNADVYITGAILPTVVVQHSPGNSSNRIIVIRGGIAASAEVTVNVSWLSSSAGSEATGNWSGDLNGNSIWQFPSLRCPD